MLNKTLIKYKIDGINYRIPFDYLARPFVVVTLIDSNDNTRNKVLNNLSDYFFTSKTVIEIRISMQGYDTLQIHRFTGTDLIVNFKDGSVLTANDLTTAELQAIHIAEEGRDQTVEVAKVYADIATEASEKSQEYFNQIKNSGVYGYIPVGSFNSGGTVSLYNEVLSYKVGELITFWRWDGNLPKTVGANSTPENSGGIGSGKWIDVTDATLRGNLQTSEGASLIRTKYATTVQQELDKLDEETDTLFIETNKYREPSNKIELVAHRGYSETYPEQTLLGYSLTKCDAFEIDIQMTKDGHPVCFHDDDMQHATDKVGAIKDLTLQEVSSARFKRLEGTRYHNHVGVPTLGQVCKIANRRGIRLVSEIKGYRTINDVLEYAPIIQHYGLLDSCTFICFDFEPLKILHTEYPQATYGLVIGTYAEYLDPLIYELSRWGGGYLHLSRAAAVAVGYSKLRVWESFGLKLNVWTIYTQDQAQEILDLGITRLSFDKDYYNTYKI